MPGGKSYIAQLIYDAGGAYLWSDTNSQGALPLDFERVFFRAATADIWLNPGVYRSRQALLAVDPRFGKFHAARTGHIYNNTRRQTKTTGNPIWETGVVRPDVVLADLIRIFHPDRLPEYESVYCEQLE